MIYIFQRVLVTLNLTVIDELFVFLIYLYKKFSLYHIILDRVGPFLTFQQIKMYYLYPF